MNDLYVQKGAADRAPSPAEATELPALGSPHPSAGLEDVFLAP